MNLLTCSEKTEKIFEKYFQRNICLSVKNEVFKKGKFLLIRNFVSNNNYYFEIVVERFKKLDTIKIPYPFNVEEYEKENLLFLDYRVDCFLNKDKNLKQILDKWMKEVEIKNTNKFFNNILEIKFE